MSAVPAEGYHDESWPYPVLSLSPANTHRGPWTLVFPHRTVGPLRASASRTGDGKWYIRIAFIPLGKSPTDETRAFSSIEEVKRFISEYFEVPVALVSPSDFPRAEDL